MQQFDAIVHSDLQLVHIDLQLVQTDLNLDLHLVHIDLKLNQARRHVLPVPLIHRGGIVAGSR
jgi:hypothetical protein